MSDGIRAVRNNNPGNIDARAGGKVVPWQGLMPREEMTPAQKAETRFAVFATPADGFRALARNLITYQDKRRTPDGGIIDTVREAITRWAPPKENNTEQYIKRVCALTGFDEHQTLDFHKYEDVRPLAKAISIVECDGVWAFSDEDLDAGLRAAGVKPPADRLVQNPTVRATTIAGAATTLGLVGETVSQITPATSLAREIAEYAPTAAAIIVLIVVGLVIWNQVQNWQRSKQV